MSDSQTQLSAIMQMLNASGAPLTAENLNRASLHMARGEDNAQTPMFEKAIEKQVTNPTPRQARTAQTQAEASTPPAAPAPPVPGEAPHAPAPRATQDLPPDTAVSPAVVQDAGGVPVGTTGAVAEPPPPGEPAPGGATPAQKLAAAGVLGATGVAAGAPFLQRAAAPLLRVLTGRKGGAAGTRMTRRAEDAQIRNNTVNAGSADVLPDGPAPQFGRRTEPAPGPNPPPGLPPGAPPAMIPPGTVPAGGLPPPAMIPPQMIPAAPNVPPPLPPGTAPAMIPPGTAGPVRPVPQASTVVPPSEVRTQSAQRSRVNMDQAMQDAAQRGQRHSVIDTKGGSRSFTEARDARRRAATGGRR